MRRVALGITAFWLLACSGTESAPAPAPTDEAPPVPVSTPRATPVLDVWADGAAYSEQWLVILSSKEELGHVPEGLTALEGLADVVSHPVRLSSSQFKGLMPCYEIVVAEAFSDRKQAIAYSRELTARGIDNYPKNAGAFVGTQAPVEAYCAERRAPAGDGCEDFGFVESWGGEVFLDLDLSEQIEARISLDAPPRKLTDQAWVAELPQESLEGLANGDAVALYGWGGEPAGRCTVSGFVALTRGTAHWGWEQDAPGCGEPEAFARLDCGGGGEGADYAVREGGALPLMRPREAQASQVTAGLEALQAQPLYQDLRRQLEAESGDQRLEEGPEVQVWEGDGGSWLSVTSWLFTGEGMDMCGADEINRRVTGVWRLEADGSLGALAWVRDTSWTELVALGDLDGDGSPEVVEQSFPSEVVVRDPSGVEQCAQRIAYCDCPC